MTGNDVLDRVSLPGIIKSLNEGCRIHGFRSGGGLRVVRIEINKELRGYGEHPSADEALIHASDDFLAGHRPYEEVYGKIHPHYLTGSLDITSPLDGWLLNGHTFDAWKVGVDIAVDLRGYKNQKVPEDVHRLIESGTLESARWRSRDYLFESVIDIFPDGGSSVKTVVVSGPSEGGADPWTYKISKAGKGSDFHAALDNAFDSDEEEVLE